MGLKAKAGMAGAVAMIGFTLATTPMVPKDQRAAEVRQQKQLAQQELRERQRRVREGLEQGDSLTEDRRRPVERRPPPKPPKILRIP